jgi:hypothetical protein
VFLISIQQLVGFELVDIDICHLLHDHLVEWLRVGQLPDLVQEDQERVWAQLVAILLNNIPF